MIDLSKLTTESRNPDTMGLDEMTPTQIARIMNQEDGAVIKAIEEVIPQIAQAIEWATESLKSGGRIIYVGAGTSGRLGVLDAVECPPTFGVPPQMVVGLIAGGEKAFVEAVEGAEDSETLVQRGIKIHLAVKRRYRNRSCCIRQNALCHSWTPVCTFHWL